MAPNDMYFRAASAAAKMGNARGVHHYMKVAAAEITVPTPVGVQLDPCRLCKLLAYTFDWAATHGQLALVLHWCRECESTCSQCGRDPHDVNRLCKTTRLNRALRLAARHDQLAVVRALCALPVHDGIDVAMNGNEALFIAVCYKNVRIMRALCELPARRGVDPGHGDNLFLRVAVQNGDVDVVRCLCDLPLARGVNPGINDNMMVILAARGGHIGVVEYLCQLPLERGVDPSARDDRALMVAMEERHIHVIEYLCALPAHRGVDLVAHGAWVLRRAVQWREVGLVRVLCELLRSRRIDCTSLSAHEPLWTTLVPWTEHVRTDALRRRKAIVWCLFDLPAAVHSTPACKLVHRMIDAASQEEVSWTQVQLLPFVVRELPGGDQWCDQCGDGRMQVLRRIAKEGRYGHIAALVVNHDQQQRWKRRRTVLLLRYARANGRGHPRALPKRVAGASRSTCAVGVPGRAQKRRRTLSLAERCRVAYSLARCQAEPPHAAACRQSKKQPERSSSRRCYLGLNQGPCG